MQWKLNLPVSLTSRKYRYFGAGEVITVQFPILSMRLCNYSVLTQWQESR